MFCGVSVVFDPLDKEFIIEREKFVSSRLVSPSTADAKIPEGLPPEAFAMSVNYGDLRGGFEAGWIACLEKLKPYLK
jgi:hypothetical protein